MQIHGKLQTASKQHLIIVICNYKSVHIPGTNRHRLCLLRTMTGATKGAGVAYTSGAPEFIHLNKEGIERKPKGITDIAILRIWNRRKLTKPHKLHILNSTKHAITRPKTENELMFSGRIIGSCLSSDISGNNHFSVQFK